MSLDGWVDSGCFELCCCLCLWTSHFEGKATKVHFPPPKHDMPQACISPEHISDQSSCQETLADNMIQDILLKLSVSTHATLPT